MVRDRRTLNATPFKFSETLCVRLRNRTRQQLGNGNMEIRSTVLAGTTDRSTRPQPRLPSQTSGASAATVLSDTSRQGLNKISEICQLYCAVRIHCHQRKPRGRVALSQLPRKRINTKDKGYYARHHRICTMTACYCCLEINPTKLQDQQSVGPLGLGQ